VEWDWSGGIAGKGSLNDYKKVLEGSWGAITSAFHYYNIHAAFDPQRRIAVFTATVDLNINAKGAAADCWGNTAIKTPVSWTLKMNEDLKITYFGGTWNPDENAECAARAMQAMTGSYTAPTMMAQDMNAVANTWIAGFLETLVAGFKSGNFDDNLKYFADNVKWSWSGGIEGAGTREDYKAVILGSWGAIVSDMSVGGMQMAFDPYDGKLSTVFNLFLNINARSSDPANNCYLVGDNGGVSWNFNVDQNQKITNFEGVWDPAATADCVAKASALLSQ